MDNQQHSLLQMHQVVLGRYDKGKHKSLTPATEIYRKVRSQMPRRGKLETTEVNMMKKTVWLLLQEQLEKINWPKSPPITFWVDTEKAETDKTLTRLKLASPDLVFWQEPCSDKITYFVQDNNNEYLERDLAGHWRALKIPEAEKARIREMLKYPAAFAQVDRQVATTEASVVSVSTGKTISEHPRREPMDHSSFTMDIDTPQNHANSSSPFGLQVGSSPLEEQMDVICGKW